MIKKNQSIFINKVSNGEESKISIIMKKTWKGELSQLQSSDVGEEHFTFTTQMTSHSNAECRCGTEEILVREELTQHEICGKLHANVILVKLKIHWNA